MVYTHVKVNEHSGYGWEIVGYKLRLENDTVNWESELLQPLDIDSLGLLFGVQMPADLVTADVMFTCSMQLTKSVSSFNIFKWKSVEEIKSKSWDYGGVNLSRIQLEINSEPKGAEVYLIPNRVWMRDFEGEDVSANVSRLQRYRVNTSFTDTHVTIDQTVFRILFKLDGQMQNIVHYTKPQSVEPTQKVFVKF